MKEEEREREGRGRRAGTRERQVDPSRRFCLALSLARCARLSPGDRAGDAGARGKRHVFILSEGLGAGAGCVRAENRGGRAQGRQRARSNSLPPPPSFLKQGARERIRRMNRPPGNLGQVRRDAAVAAGSARSGGRVRARESARSPLLEKERVPPGGHHGSPPVVLLCVSRGLLRVCYELARTNSAGGSFSV